MQRLARTVTLLVVIAALTVGGVVAVDRFTASDTEPVVIEKPELGTAVVIRTDLVERETFEATLGYPADRVIAAQLAGTVTATVEVGAEVGVGDVLVEIDGLPVVVFLGDRPMWRPILDGIDEGRDVRQLEENLAALGYVSDGDEELIVDETFDAATADVIAQWREGLGMSDDPVVELGRIVYLDGRARIGDVLAPLGSMVGPGAPLVQLTATQREVALLLPVDRQDLVAVGDAVRITLPDDEVVTGVVEDIGTSVVAEAGPGGAARLVPVTISLPDDLDLDLDEAPVDVELVTDRAAGVLAVPVNALLALAEGGYALDVERNGETVRVAVDTGAFVDGLVEVSGDIADGDVVVVPK